MLHPVAPPPELPIVIDSLAVADVSTDNSSTLKNSTVTPQASPIAQTSFSLSEHFSPPKSFLNKNQSLSKTNEPETILPPEFSPISVANNAASLGEKFNVIYPSENKQVSSEGFEHFEAASFTQKQTESVTKITKTPEKLKSKKKTAPETQKPTKIEFYSQNTNSTKTPATIEFKSRSQVQVPQQVPLQQTPPQQTIPVPQPTGQPQPSQAPVETRRVIEIIADRQIYDENRRVVTAEGNVVVRFDGSVVDADSLQVNIDNLIAVGEGNVAVTRGEQVLRGNRFTYNFIQDTGDLEGGSGEVNIAQAQQDLSFDSAPVAAGGVPRRPPSDRIRQNQPLTGVGSPGGVGFNLGGRPARNLPSAKTGGEVRRVRFEAAQIDFYPRGWEAKDVRITNDPFSPPELELRANSVTLERISPRQDKLRLRKPRLVFDQGLTLGIPGYTRTIDREQRDATPAPVSIGFDGDERGGLYIERSFQVANTPQFSWKVTPQFFAQQAVQNNNGGIPALFGLKSSLNATLNPRSQVRASTTLTSLDLTDLEDNLRASVRYNYLLGNPLNPYQATLEYSYRDRLYNGSLGFQTVQSSFGGVIISPNIPLGKTGLNLRYQAGAQRVNARTDRQDLLDVGRSNDRVSLNRLQASATIGGAINLWQGKPLAPTREAGLKYTANPVVPYVQVFGNVTGTGSFYSNGDEQNTLIGSIGLQGQFGNFSKKFLDYTGFNVTYSQGTNDGLSPFLFDRYADRQVLSAGFTQQLYGPFRLGFQTTINLDTSERTSTDYILEYSRRTYGISLRYNPVLELGGISFRISDFNWSGGTDPFSDDTGGVKPVVGGVEQR
jgi:lipopolysaccharide export system protein LptA